MLKSTIAIMAFLFIITSPIWGDIPVTKMEFANQNQKSREEFREIAVTLAEIKNELGHINRDLGELKDMRRTVFQRMIDIGLAGGLAFSGAAAWRNRRNGKVNGN